MAEEEGICPATLYNWRKQARRAGRLLPANGSEPEGWSSRIKFNAVLKTAALSEPELQAGRMRSDIDPGIATISLMSLAVWPFVAGPIVQGVFGMELDSAFAGRFADHNTRLFCEGALLQRGASKGTKAS